MASERNKTKQCLAVVMTVLIIVAAIVWHYQNDPWGYYWKCSPQEAKLRNLVVSTAQSYLGYNEAEGSHAKIIDIYNRQEPLPEGYLVKYTDSWCATFVSTVALRTSMTDIIPTECSCERQIGLFQSLDRWEEADTIIPLPGDIIYYDWDQTRSGENSGWSDHVGIVVGTKWPFLKVIEGNKEDSVSYRILLIGDKQIRGFGQPDYTSLVK